MNTRQSMVTWFVSVVVCISMIRVIQLNNYYAHGYRLKDKEGNIIHFASVGRKDIWKDVLRGPLINTMGALGVGVLLIYVLRDKKK